MICLKDAMGGRLHIMILGHVPLPEDHPDASKLSRHPGRWVFDQAKAVSDFSPNYKVTLVTLVKGASRDYEKEFGRLRVVYLKAQGKLRERTGFAWDILRLRKLIRREQPDLVHAHGTEDAYGLAATTVNIPKVLTVQGLYHDVNEQAHAPFYSPPYVLEKLESLCLRRFDRAIVKSNHVAQVVKRFFNHLELCVIPNTLSERFLGWDNVVKNPRKLAFVGAVLPRKGFHHIREALELLSSEEPLELHVYGDSAERNYIERESGLIRKSGHRVVMHGNISADELARELQSVNILIAPSYAETFGNQVIEAMLCRCHCIVSDETGMAENVRKYGHGTVVPQRGADEIADAIKIQLSDGPSEQEMQLRELTRSKVIDDLGPEKVASQLQAIYGGELGS